MNALKEYHFLFQGLVNLYKIWKTSSQQPRWDYLREYILFWLMKKVRSYALRSYCGANKLTSSFLWASFVLLTSFSSLWWSCWEIWNIFLLYWWYFIIQKIGESEADYLKKIKQVLERLDAKEFCANLMKSFVMQKEVEYLGYLLTTCCLKP